LQNSQPVQYETPAKAAMRLDMGVGQQERLKDPSNFRSTNHASNHRDIAAGFS
jgi:hypothetical protein